MSEREVYSGNILKVTEERINNHLWERVYIPPGVLIFPITPEGKILMIEEFRPHETPSLRLKAVTGFLDSDDFEAEVNRELQEEVKLKAKKVECFLNIKTTGTLNTTNKAALCWGLESSPLPNPDGDVIEAIREFSLEELVERTLSGELERGFSAYCFMKLAEEKRRGLRNSLLQKSP